MPKTRLLEKSKLRNGYSVAVKDNLGQKIFRRHISNEEAEQYIKEFGRKMISDSEFFTWYCKINKLSKEDYSYLLSQSDIKNLKNK